MIIKKTGFRFSGHKDVFYSLLIFGLIFCLSGVVSAHTDIGGGVCYCGNSSNTSSQNCDDCEMALNDTACINVKLNISIINHTGTCVNNTANVSNKTFNCQGYTIDGNKTLYTRTGYGIYIKGKDNVTIKNCIIMEFDTGIYFNASNNITLKNNTIYSNNDGISLHYTNNTLITDVNSSDNRDYGLHLYRSNWNNLTGSYFSHNLDPAVYLEYSHNNTLTENNAIDTVDSGFYLKFSFNNTLIANNASDNSHYGVTLENSNYNTLVGNNFSLNTRGGITLRKSNYNNVSGNDASLSRGGGSTYGIIIDNSDNNVFSNNTANSNTNGYGIYVYDSDLVDPSASNMISNNKVHSNFYGIYLTSFSYLTNVTNNNLTGNTRYSLVNGHCNNEIDISNTGGSGKPIRYEHNLAGLTIQDTDAYSSLILCNVNDSTIDNLTIDNGNVRTDGIYLGSCNNLSVINSNISNSFCGVKILGGSKNVIINNIFAFNNKTGSEAGGVYMYYSDSNRIESNNLIGNYKGIQEAGLGDYNNISHNSITSTLQEGIMISGTNNLVYNNTINSNGYYGITLATSFADQNTIINNTLTLIDSKGIYIYWGSSNNVSYNKIDRAYEYGIYVENSQLNTISYNYVTSTRNYLPSTKSYGIYLRDGARYSNFTGNTLILNDYGMYLYGVYGNNIGGNNLTNNNLSSLFGGLDWWCDNTIDASNIGGINGKPIRYEHDTSNIVISDTSEYSEIVFCNVDNSTIRNVTIDNGALGSDGILMYSSDNNKVVNSTIQNAYYGTYMPKNSNSNNITGSTMRNVYYGLYAYASDSNLLYNSTLANNTYGVYLTPSSSNYNVIYNNSFSDSLQYHAYVDQYADGNNFSDNSTGTPRGNYWDDIKEKGLDIVDLNWDGFGDSGSQYPYNSSNGGNVSINVNDWGPVITDIGTGINSCQSLDSAGTTYFLTADLNSNGTCFTIDAGNIFLDCQGHMISGNNTGYGVIIINHGNVTIKNCTITGFEMGIYLNYSNKNTIKDNLIYNNSRFGITLKESDNNTIESNEVYNQTTYWNSLGIAILTSSDYNNISSNIVHDNKIDNIELWDNSYYNEIWNNTLYDAEYGILMSRESNSNTIKENRIYGNTYGMGIGHESEIWGGGIENNTIQNNIIKDNEVGIRIINSSYNKIINNKCRLNNNTGIYSQNSNSTINSNIVCNNINLDFNSSDWESSSGDNNTCDNANGWNDSGATKCKYVCGTLGPQANPTNETGAKITVFDPGDGIYVKGSGFDDGFNNVDIYIVNNTDQWYEGMLIPGDVRESNYNSSVPTNGDGTLGPLWIWGSDPGYYDIVIDQDQDGYYNDTRDAVSSATYDGFYITPEPMAAVLFVAGLSLVYGLARVRKS